MKDRETEGYTMKPHWMTAERIRLYPRIIIIVYVIGLVLWVVSAEGMIDYRGKPLGADFMSHWSGGRLALGGEPEAAYEPARLLEASRQGVAGNQARFMWSYPPTYHLLMLPLGVLPYGVALFLWSLIQVGLFAFAMSALVPSRPALWCALAFPGLFLNLIQGQNGLFITALVAGAVVFMERRPALAGAMIGLLSFKPHLGILFPIALAAGRYWRVFISATIVTLIFLEAAFLAFSGDVFAAFFNNLSFASHVVETGALPWYKMPSLFVSLLEFGVAVPLAWAAQGLAFVGLAGLLGVVWWRRPPVRLAMAVLIPAALLASPHINDYDLCLMAVPIAILGWHGYQNGWLRWEREGLLAAWLIPILDAPLAQQTGLHAALFINLMMIFLALRRLGHLPD
ncbi:MAG: DUF2029 domain-containing protein [Rhodospirillaceae bacterium]|nr:DUF2029 domain-containing protein [Rhodospirillaceae bacterium]